MTINNHSISEIEKIRINMAKVYALRTEIALQRQKAIRLLTFLDGTIFNKTSNLEAEKIIERCINDDKRLMIVIKKGIKDLLEIEEEVVSWAESSIKSKDTRRRISAIFEITAEYNGHIPLIEDRMSTEENFLAILKKHESGKIQQILDERKRMFDRYMSLWESELKEETKILEKSVEIIYESAADQFLKQALSILKKGTINVVGVTGLASLMHVLVDQIHPFKSDFNNLLIVIAVLGAGAGVMMTFKDRYNTFLELHKQQVSNIAKLKH